MNHETPLVRVGFGYDVHALAPDRALILGGVHVPFPAGLAGHSDADVLIHAVMDAIVGALGLGDIGRHFPDSDPALEGISSLILLDEVHDMLMQQGWCINNLDATVVAERPKLAPFVPEMRERIARTLQTPAECINIKATTTEGLGFCGRGEGIAAYAIVSLRPVGAGTP
nr:2-C-methyl-D-erythritol 2,4-cyclodiphosphate synthase [Desulfatiglans anilini]